MNILTLGIIIYVVYFLVTMKRSCKVEQFSNSDNTRSFITEFFEKYKSIDYSIYLEFMEKKGLKYPHTVLDLEVYRHFKEKNDWMNFKNQNKKTFFD